MSDKKFASQADLDEKKISFDKLSDHAYAYTAEGDPNTGIVVGDDAVMVIDTQATPVMAQDVDPAHPRGDRASRSNTSCCRTTTRCACSARPGTRPEHIIASRDTYDLIVERGEADMKSEIERFPRLFRAVESVPGLTWPTLVFEKQLTLWLGKLQVEIMQLGRGHTKGDTVVWLPQERILFSGDLVEYGATPYTGDAYLTDWPATLDAIADARAAEARARTRRIVDESGRRSRRASTARAHSSREMFERREARRGRRKRSAHRLQGNVCDAQAEVRTLGHFRPLPAVRRDSRRTTKRHNIATRASGPRSATRRCGSRLRASSQ